MERIKIDEKKRALMYGEIRVLEAENLKTGKYDDKTMVKLISNIIKKYVEDGR